MTCIFTWSPNRHQNRRWHYRKPRPSSRLGSIPPSHACWCWARKPDHRPVSVSDRIADRKEDPEHLPRPEEPPSPLWVFLETFFVGEWKVKWRCPVGWRGRWWYRRATKWQLFRKSMQSVSKKGRIQPDFERQINSVFKFKSFLTNKNFIEKDWKVSLYLN